MTAAMVVGAIATAIIVVQLVREARLEHRVRVSEYRAKNAENRIKVALKAAQDAERECGKSRQDLHRADQRNAELNRALSEISAERDSVAGRLRDVNEDRRRTNEALAAAQRDLQASGNALERTRDKVVELERRTAVLRGSLATPAEIATLMVHADRALPKDERAWPGIVLAEAVSHVSHPSRGLEALVGDREALEEKIAKILDKIVAA